jgi:antibiotic biosynthesis monooxygenase (ABM) superfamily enzyme
MSDTATDIAAAEGDRENVVATVAPVAPPSVHVRAVVTWLAIFPLVSIGMLLLGPVSESWHPILRALVLTAVVVPRLLGAYTAFSRRRASGRR